MPETERPTTHPAPQVRNRRLAALTVPDELQRNDPSVLVVGVENTGAVLLGAVAQRIGRPDLAGFDLLDIGCGVRFAQTLINRELPFTSYTGIDVWKPLVTWMQENVENHDDRFRFAHWDVYNAMYNRAAPPMESFLKFPIMGTYDVVMGFSLFTHLNPDDTVSILRFARHAVRDSGYLFFTAFCDDAIEGFEDRVPERPLLNAFYNPDYLQKLLAQTGWETVSQEKPVGYMQHSFLCRPATLADRLRPD